MNKLLLSALAIGILTTGCAGITAGSGSGAIADTPITSSNFATGIDDVITWVENECKAYPGQAAVVVPAFESVSSLINADLAAGVATVGLVGGQICDAVAALPAGTVVMSMSKAPPVHVAVVRAKNGAAIPVKYKIVKRK